MDPKYIQQNNEPIANGELRRTLQFIGEQLRRHQDVLTSMQTEVNKLVAATRPAEQK